MVVTGPSAETTGAFVGAGGGVVAPRGAVAPSTTVDDCAASTSPCSAAQPARTAVTATSPPNASLRTRYVVMRAPPIGCPLDPTISGAVRFRGEAKNLGASGWRSVTAPGPLPRRSGAEDL